MQVPIELTFLDLNKKGKSIRGTEAYADLATGFLHSGCTYKGQIEMDGDSAWVLEQMFAFKLQPVFWVSGRQVNQLKLPDLLLAADRFFTYLDNPPQGANAASMVEYEKELRLRLEQMRTALEKAKE